MTDKAMLRQFNRYVENKMTNYISAFKEGCSTEMVLLDVSDDILMNMDRQRITLMVCTDLLAAFNMVDLYIMLAVLEVSCGVKGNVLNWCDSYLRGHSARVKIKDTISDKINVDFSVPQGSVMRPYFLTCMKVLYHMKLRTFWSLYLAMQMTTILGIVSLPIQEPRRCVVMNT